MKTNTEEFNKTVVFIPVRGGSKSIPLKNIKIIAGKPLVYWSIKAANDCKKINKIFVSTDSEEIKKAVNSFNFKKVVVINRSKKTATDTASTESAMLEFANNYSFSNIVLIQATSPLITSKDLDNGFKIYSKKNVDSVLSVVRQKRFIWSKKKNSYLPVNYNYLKRPRRQEFDGFLVENGAFYITSKKALLKSKCRISGNIQVVEMNENSYYEIDEPNDFNVIESLMKRNNKITIPDIKMVLTDCDGCLTDGGMYYSEKGDELKKFNTKDGVGFSKLKKAGIIVGIITGEKVELNKNRAKKLKADIFIDGCTDKFSNICSLSKKYKIDLKNICYIGDDINDLKVLQNVGFSCCPADAQDAIKQKSDYICRLKGGEGCFREIVELILNNK